jgi:hypothetical protein
MRGEVKRGAAACCRAHVLELAPDDVARGGHGVKVLGSSLDVAHGRGLSVQVPGARSVDVPKRIHEHASQIMLGEVLLRGHARASLIRGASTAHPHRRFRGCVAEPVAAHPWRFQVCRPPLISI